MTIAFNEHLSVTYVQYDAAVGATKPANAVVLPRFEPPDGISLGPASAAHKSGLESLHNDGDRFLYVVLAKSLLGFENCH
jgi:hypothetical protein